jgi:RNA polymerase sigma-70 factor (ECF subfamily)
VSENRFLTLIKENQGIIYKLVSIYANDADEKKDMYQEILLNAWKGWPAFRGDSKFSTWLYRISLNTLLTLKRKPSRIDYTDSLNDISPLTDTNSIYNDDSMRLRQAIRLLSETNRAIVSMHLDGYENSEIAEFMGISNNHVSVKLHRCKEEISNLLKR